MVKQRTAKIRPRAPILLQGLAAAAALAGWATVWTPDARASGIASARFGGEHGHPTTSNPTAVYYNPAGLALSQGTHIFADGTLVLRWAGYDRPALGPDDVAAGETPVQDSQATLELAPGANDGRGTLFNALASPFVGVSSDFGTDFIYGGVSLSFPFGGSAVWDKNGAFEGNPDYPGAVDGQQRWYSIDGSIRSMYVSGALAVNIRQTGLSIGVSGSAIRSSVNTLRARNADGTDDLVDGNGQLKEGRSRVDVHGWQGGFGVGLVYDVLKRGKYFVGASYASQPNVTGGMTLSGTLRNALAATQAEQSNVEFDQTLPDIIRLGVRIRPTDRYELRLFGDYTRWSVAEAQCLIDVGSDNGAGCDFENLDDALDDPGSVTPRPNSEGDTNPGVVQHLPRFWKDAGGVRLGGSYWFVPEVEGYLGVGYDSSAVPVETLDPAQMDMHKVSLAVGVRWQIIEQLAMAFTATELFYVRTNTEGKSVLNEFTPPTRQPSGDGEYTQFLQLFNVYADISF